MASSEQVKQARERAGQMVGAAVTAGRNIAAEANSRSQRIAKAVRAQAGTPTKAALMELRTAGSYARKALEQAAVAAKTAGSAAKAANRGVATGARTGVIGPAQRAMGAAATAARRITPSANGVRVGSSSTGRRSGSSRARRS